ncbi:hypothetical protein IIA28_14570 [candidate division KSB1 bacterium]|nr:hypothetical protein [candidate division KSB1 bacterium]
MSKIQQIILVVTKLKNALSFSKNPPVDLDKLQTAILRQEKYIEHRSLQFAVLSHRLYTNPITNKAIARYVWDLHEMNFN